MAKAISCQSSVPLEDGVQTIAITAGHALLFHQGWSAVATRAPKRNCTRGFCKIPCSCQRSAVSQHSHQSKASGRGREHKCGDMSPQSSSEETLSSAIASGNRLEFSFLQAGQDIDVIHKKSNTSVYKLIR